MTFGKKLVEAQKSFEPRLAVCKGQPAPKSPLIIYDTSKFDLAVIFLPCPILSALFKVINTL